MKKIIFLLFIPFLLFAYKVDIKKWDRHYTFYQFLKDYKIPVKVYYNLAPTLKREVRHINNGTVFFILKDNNSFKQALIPLNSKQQLQIIKKNNKYVTKIVPIIYDTATKKVSVTINRYLSYDIYKATGSNLLTQKLINIFSDKINFKAIPKGTVINAVYEEKSRFGKIKDIKILFASVKNRYYSYMAFLNPNDGRYYDEHAKSLKGMFLQTPLRYKRISSYFGMRFHPILHKWRMHDGIDYVNRIGTPVHSVADGKVIYKGWVKGYGRVVKIRHKNGYITLYAHLHGWPRGIYNGKWVKQGQTIGYLGNSGLSTGPHLHFGVMHYGRWINPLKIKNSARITLWGKARKKYLSYIKNFIKENNIALK